MSFVYDIAATPWRDSIPKGAVRGGGPRLADADTLDSADSADVSARYGQTTTYVITYIIN